MLANPSSVPSQAVILNALQQTVVQYPVCEAWISLIGPLNARLSWLTPTSVRRSSDIAFGVAKVFRWIQGQIPSEYTCQSYVGGLAIAAQRFGRAARLASIGSAGGRDITLSSAAVTALQALTTWDSVLGNYQPSDPAGTGLTLVRGVTLP